MFKFSFVFIVFIFSGCLTCFSQEKKPGENIYEVLSEKERTEWYKSRKVWEEKYFYPFLKRNKIKFSCAHCESVYFDVEIEVMEDGHAHTKIVWNKKCGGEFTSKQIAELDKLLFNIQLSSELKSKNFVARIGNGLKC